MEVAGANAGWRWQFRFAVRGFWSGVAQLFSLDGMNALAFIGPASKLRRFLFAVAGICTVVSVMLLVYWPLSGSSLMILSASAFDTFDSLPAIFAMIMMYFGGFYFCANLIVELIRMLKPSSGSWTDAKHFKMVRRVFVALLLLLVVLSYIVSEPYSQADGPPEP
jgi:hypothetical protein